MMGPYIFCFFSFFHSSFCTFYVYLLPNCCVVPSLLHTAFRIEVTCLDYYYDKWGDVRFSFSINNGD